MLTLLRVLWSYVPIQEPLNARDAPAIDLNILDITIQDRTNSMFLENDGETSVVSQSRVGIYLTHPKLIFAQKKQADTVTLYFEAMVYEYPVIWSSSFFGTFSGGLVFGNDTSSPFVV